jgi:phage recombination protein Bet
METKEKQVVTEVIEGSAGVVSRGPLAKVVQIDEARVDLFNPLKWSRDDVELIKQTVCPKGIPDAEFKLFIAKCQASGMNPLLGEAFCVDRNQNIGTKENPKWIKVYVFTPGEQGMEARADDFPDYRGIRAAAVYEKDKILIDASTGVVSHQYNPVGDRGRLLGAWAIAYREGRQTPVEYVAFSEYYDDRNPQWKSRPATMIVKCARAAALRRAYPNKFTGIYVREELRDEAAADGELTPAQDQQANRSTTDVLADRLKQQRQPDASRPGAESVKASQATVDVVVEKPKEQPRPSPTPPPRSGQAGPSTTNADPAVAEAKKLIARCEALKVDYDGQKLLEDRHYREALSAELDKLAKRAAGAISENSMEGAARNPPVEAPKPDQGPLMIYDLPERKTKGLPISSLSGPELLIAITWGEQKIPSLQDDTKSTAAQKTAKVRACIDAVKAEMKKREAAAIGEEPSREPGEDDGID